MSQIERRSFEMRASEDGQFALAGRAVKYNTLSQPIGGAFVEQVAPGAFSDSLADGDQKFYWSHDMSLPLARRSNGSLQIVDSPSELRFVAKLDPQVQAHHDYYNMVKSNLVHEMSFGFSCDGPGSQDWDKTKNPPVRTVRKAKLYEISLCTEPAYAGSTSAEARRAGAAQISPALAEAVAVLRRANRAFAAARIDAAKRDVSLDPMRCLEGHCRVIGEACELASAISGTMDEIVDAWDDDEMNDEDRARRDATAMDEVFRKAHKAAHRCMELACASHAERQLALAKWSAKK